MTVDARSCTGTSLSVPPKPPTGVRRGSQMTASRTTRLLVRGPGQRSRLHPGVCPLSAGPARPGSGRVAGVPYPGAFAATTPDKPAVIMAGSGETLSYAQLEERSARLADHLRTLGLRTGDVVALLTDNRPQACEVYWGCQRSGLYVTAVNWHLTAGEAAYVVGDCGARVLIASAALGDLAREVRAVTPAVTETLAFAGPIEGFGDYAAARAAADPTPPAEQPRGADMLYSSGTTGRPKGIKPQLP